MFLGLTLTLETFWSVDEYAGCVQPIHCPLYCHCELTMSTASELNDNVGEYLRDILWRSDLPSVALGHTSYDCCTNYSDACSATREFQWHVVSMDFHGGSLTPDVSTLHTICSIRLPLSLLLWPLPRLSPRRPSSAALPPSTNILEVEAWPIPATLTLWMMRILASRYLRLPLSRNTWSNGRLKANKLVGWQMYIKRF